MNSSQEHHTTRQTGKANKAFLTALIQGCYFLIVKDMLLTGFDAPVEQVMYLDRPLKNMLFAPSQGE